MIFPADAFKKYGKPAADNPCMILWDVPEELEIGIIPKRIYCNKDMVKPLTKAFKALIKTGKVAELKTWDGCFNIRKIRGGNLPSLHSWGLAIDVNAFENGLKQQPKLSPEFVKCFTDAGFDWGGNWKSRVDGMHFQLAKI
jgi:hypothetical protein